MRYVQGFAQSFSRFFALYFLLWLAIPAAWLYKQDEYKGLLRTDNTAAYVKCSEFVMGFVTDNFLLILLFVALALAALLPGLIADKEQEEREAKAEEREARAEERHVELLKRIDERNEQAEQNAERRRTARNRHERKSRMRRSGRGD